MIKKLLLIGLLTFTVSAFANGTQLPPPAPSYPPPPPIKITDKFPMSAYFGITGGYGRIDEGDGIEDAFNTIARDARLLGLTASESDDKGFLAGGGFIGFRFSPFMAIQTGYLYFMPNDYRVKVVDPGIESLKTTAKVNMQTLNAVLKFILPLGNTRRGYARFELFGLGGAAYVWTHIKLDIKGSVGGFPVSIADSSNNDGIRPLVGGGFTVHITRLVSLDFSYTHIFGHDLLKESDVLKGVKDTIPSGNLAAISIVFSGPVTGIGDQ